MSTPVVTTDSGEFAVRLDHATAQPPRSDFVVSNNVLTATLSKPLSEGNGTYSVTAMLNPPSLGHMQAVVKVDGTNVNVAIVAHTPRRPSRIAAHLDELRTELQAHGGDVQLSLSDGGAKGGRRDRSEPPPAATQESEQPTLSSSALPRSRGQVAARDPLGGPMIQSISAVAPSRRHSATYKRSTRPLGRELDVTGSGMSALLGPNEFLSLLVDNLKYQDPLDPTSSADLLTQLASLSQVQTQQQIAETDQTSAAANLIGDTDHGKRRLGVAHHGRRQRILPHLERTDTRRGRQLGVARQHKRRRPNPDRFHVHAIDDVRRSG